MTSGLRIGTPAVTSRGFKEADMVTIARIMKMAAVDFETKRAEIEAEVKALCAQHPIYEG